MKTKPLLLSLIGAGALAGWLAAPVLTQAQTPTAVAPTAAANAAAEAEAAALAALLAELTAQSVIINENQTKIDQQIAVVAESVRVARIFAARGGGGKK